MRFPDLPNPRGTTIVTMEMQRGIVGDLATIPTLANAAAESGVISRCAELVTTARSVGVPVVHATVSWRADRRGTTINTPLTASLARNPEQILEGTEAVDLVPEFGDTSDDLISHRRNGMTPFPGTDLDATLRSLDTHTVIATGASVNVGVMGLVLGAADRGYRVVVCTDAVIGVPDSYAREVISQTFAMVATITTTEDLIGAWT